MAITIKDVAKDTNLSLATISKYLNGKNISAHNQKIIKKSIHKLGYTPSKAAQLLRSSKTNTICVFAPSIGDYYWSSIFYHIEEYFRSFGYSTIVLSYDTYSRDTQNSLNLLTSNHISGIVLIPFMEEENSIHHILHDANIPFVCLDQRLNDMDTDIVTSTNFQSAYDATMYLINRGHHHLGVLSAEEYSYTSNERMRGFCKACEDANISPTDIHKINSLITTPNQIKDFCQSLSQQGKPIAILSLRYDLTITFLSYLSSTDLSIPDDISLISFDDDMVFSAYATPITVILQDHKQLSYKAAETLHERINGNSSLPLQEILLPTKMIERKSVKTIS